MTVLEQAYANASAECRVVDTENRVFNTNHAVVGYYTAKSWRLPEHVTAAIANHHNALAIFSDESSRNAQFKNLLAILKMAEHICASYRVLGNQAEDHEWNSIGPSGARLCRPLGLRLRDAQANDSRPRHSSLSVG